MVLEDYKQLQKQKSRDSLEAEKMKMDKNAEWRNLQRRLKTEQTEAEMETLLAKRREEAIAAATVREEAERSIAEMNRLQNEELRERKIRQQLRESSEELKTLEAKLKAAYVSKELAAQIAEKRAAAAIEKKERRKIEEVAEAERRFIEEQEREKYQANLASKIRYRIELQDQIIAAYKRQQEAYQEFIKEKALLDQIVKAIHEEDQREEEIRLEKMQNTKQEIEQFRFQQEIWKKREEEERKKEDRRIQEYLERHQEEERKKLEELKEKDEIKKKLQERVEAEFLSKLERKREREEVLAELAAEERREREAEKAKQEIEEAVRRRQDLQRSYRQQLEERRRRLQEEEQQTELYRQQLLAKFADDTRIEQLTAEKRRLKTLEHRRQVQQLLEERQQRRRQEWEQLAKLEALRQAEEKHRRELIEEERVRLLKTHATKLLGYLPRGVLQPDDLTHLGSDFLEEFNKYKAMNCPRNAIEM
ncbi:meiosis-specific nuclear structural protein 1-like isoform X2 [Macrosteles quadrilineatus]|nr:meiosis-specific nuclear structural protein 1-like isoform X2 [Macrosteles quadrilineatus]